METSTFQVTGMSCGHCESAVREEVMQLEGVDEVQVSSSTGELSVTARASIEDNAVLAAVEEAGYEAVRSA
jgi:copper chaperone